MAKQAAAILSFFLKIDFYNTKMNFTDSLQVAALPLLSELPVFEGPCMLDGMLDVCEPVNDVFQGSLDSLKVVPKGQGLKRI